MALTLFFSDIVILLHVLESAELWERCQNTKTMHLEPMIPEKRQYRTLYLFSIDRLCHRKQYHVVMTDI